jgi:hypothetical protein
MKVLLVDFDSKIPNLALMKLSSYFKEKFKGRCEVGFGVENPDLVYVSVIFTKNKPQAAGLTTMYPNAKVEFGGSGWDLKSHLPPDIEFIKPDYDLYPSEYSQGFTTRGCIRKCTFCVVPEKEGTIQIWQHPSEFHDDRFDTCMLMDNNLFAAPQSWQDEVFSWFIDNKIKMMSPQGWDARLLTPERAAMLKSIKHVGNIHFAWDNIRDEKTIVNAIDIMKDAGFNIRSSVSFYVLVGYNSSFEEDLYRCNRLKELGTNPFVMKYHKRDKRLNNLARWANRKWLFWSMPFEEYKP